MNLESNLVQKNRMLRTTPRHGLRGLDKQRSHSPRAALRCDSQTFVIRLRNLRIRWAGTIIL